MTWLWLACVAAMLIGLAIDTRQTPAPLLASECGAPGTWWELAWRHAVLMPATSVAMALAALAPWPGAPSAAARMLCAALMAAGMVVGARLGVGMALAAGAAPFVGLVLGMAAGMAMAVLPLAAQRWA
ncbi:hypothetical protein KYT87_17560 [Achromobacter sp. ES-001]|uniref:hypothetical protein n=1 Tax=Achromobacter sp. ES-001 TaxID=2860286 RepID=UPI001C6415B7|nr:hypothetical protein [Achromobacter sp. ES-001]QYJ19534.1 hypothetical protein KYT87_17560 [Achromobacter sp. ES-001]